VQAARHRRRHVESDIFIGIALRGIDPSGIFEPSGMVMVAPGAAADVDVAFELMLIPGIEDDIAEPPPIPMFIPAIGSALPPTSPCPL
jgi:hypothetical protein